MPKRNVRGNAKDRKCSADLSDSGASPPKKSKYNLRKYSKEDGTIWIDDDTLKDEKPKVLIIEQEGSSEEEDEETEEEEEEEEEEDDEDYDEEEDEEEDVKYILKRGGFKVDNKFNIFEEIAKSLNKKKNSPKAPMQLTTIEEEYFKKQSPTQRTELLDLMKRISSIDLDQGDIPHKFKVLKMPIPDYTKSIIIKKLDALAEMTDNGESYKLKNWIEAFLRIPFGTVVPLPVRLLDGQDKCTEFMVNARKEMDATIYGMNPAKTQIMQIIAQLVVNPASVGNVIALQGPMGVGKTSFARNAIAQVLKRPFDFFSLGGSSDVSAFVGHSYTYEGSIWGRIADSLMRSKVMNPVIYFDELDKVSGTPHGEEIIGMMIHMTDRAQNTQFHDRYFSGIDFDLSQCIFVFSFNDIDKVHPILRDRMTVINCEGYSEVDKKVILKDFIWKQLLKTLMFDEKDIILKDDAIEYIISEYSKKEKGVRTLIRTVETMMTRLNMLRVAKHPSMKEYKFYMEFEFPLSITEQVVKKLLGDLDKKDIESWKTMYT